MKRKGPFLTLLAGVAVAAVLFVLNSNLKTDKAEAAQKPAANGTAATTAPPAPPPAPEAPPPAPPPAPPAAALNATWAGKTADRKVTVAIVAKGNQAIAYACDGRKLEVWLKGTAADGKLSLTGAKNTSLTGTYGNGRAKGTLVAAGKRWAFDVGAVAKPSGLYRATERVRNARIEGGWIVLADGTQVGVLSVDGVPQAAPALDLGSGSVTVGGTSITANQVDPTGESASRGARIGY
ncbi:MAG TPA: hypothetical protein VFR67_28645 [Pilimelia sp.]|nr:hypothetical protein [Pilimelia sp.]